MAQQLINVSTPGDGLGDTLRNSQIKVNANFTELYTNKVDKILGKVLSDTNYTQTEKDQLASLVAAGANVQSDWTEGNALDPAYIKNKITNVSELFNDAEYVEDVAVVGGFLRSAGEWISPLEVFTPKIMDGFIGVTVDFIVGQQAFTLPAGAKCVDVFLAHAPQYKTTDNNTSLVN